jgi:hypothetical protein
MLTTRRPLHRGAAAPSGANPHVPAELDAIVLRAVAPNPGSRFQSAAALAAELRGIAAILDLRGGAGDEGDPPAASTSVGRVVAMTLLLLAAAAAIIWWATP